MEKTMARKSIKTKKPLLVTGAAGFIGYHVCEALLKRGEVVVGFDALTPYNDPRLKKKRLEILGAYPAFSFVKGTVDDTKRFSALVKKLQPRAIVHLAAQAGVRYSIQFPQSYVDTNIRGFINVFEAVKDIRTPIVYASSSSVYGERGGIFRETDRTDTPISIYAATKKSDELIAEVYSAMYGIPVIGLRFFTVYGTWMRTDLAIFKFARLLAAGKEIPLFAKGTGKRSYAHISVVVEGTLAALDRIKQGHRVYNLGDERTYETSYMLSVLAKELGIEPKVKMMPSQRGDVPLTRASTARARKELGLKVSVPLEKGLKEFAKWFLENKTFVMGLKDMV